jgi:hypothetical protein
MANAALNLDKQAYDPSMLPSADVWAAGMTLLTMLSANNNPFQGLSIQQVLQTLASGQWTDYIPPIEVEDPKLRNTLDAILSALQPIDKRPSAAQIVAALSKA